MVDRILDTPLYTTVGQRDVACFYQLMTLRAMNLCGNKLVISTLSEGIA